MTYCRHSQCLVQQHAASFIAHTEASTGSELPRFINAESGHKQSSGLFVPGEGPGHWPGAACKAEFDAFLECGILAHGFLRLRCGACGHDKLLAFSCKRRGFCPSTGRAVCGPCKSTERFVSRAPAVAEVDRNCRS